jgi:rod shape-determining protein MreC
MRSLLNFLLRFKTLILFITLEAVALVMITSSHNYQQSITYNTARTLSGFIAKGFEKTQSYFRLRQVNQDLVRENLMLRRHIEQLTSVPQTGITEVVDSAAGIQYTYLTARVINNSVNKQKNFITLDKGSKQGVTNGMGVTSPDGVAGVVVGVSKNYSVAMSLLNADFRLSTSIARNDYFGSLAWDGINYRYAQLSEIPHHVRINAGDTIVTSGFSAIFPPGLMVGTLTGDQKRGGDFLTLKVLLSVDFKKLTTVYLIGNMSREERVALEKEVINE